MKKTMKNRLLASVLALVMALGLLPMGALAAGVIRDDTAPAKPLGEETGMAAPAEVPSAGAAATLSEGEVENLALNGAVYASGTEHPLSRAVDGDIGTHWGGSSMKDNGAGTATAANAVSWFVVDLMAGSDGAARETVASVTGISMVFNLKVWPTACKVQAAVDGAVDFSGYETPTGTAKKLTSDYTGTQNAIDAAGWTEIASFTKSSSDENNNVTMTVSAADLEKVPAGVRYIRVYFTGINTNAGGTCIGMKELTVNGTRGAVVLPEPDFQFPTADEIVYQQVKTQAELPTDGRLVAFVQPEVENNGSPRILYHASGSTRTDQLEVTITGETVALNHNQTAFTKERQLWAVVRTADGYKLKSWDDSHYLTAAADSATPKQLAVDETGAVFTVEAQSDGTFYVKSGDQYLRFYDHSGNGWGMSDTATPLKLFTPVAAGSEEVEPPEPNADQCWAYVSFSGKWGLSTTPYTLTIHKAADDSDTTGTEVTSLEDLESGASYFLKSSSHFMHRANGQSTNQCMNAGCGTMHMFKLALDSATGCWTIQSRQDDGYYLSIAGAELELHNQLPFSATAQNFVIKKVDGGFTVAAIVAKPAGRTEEATLTRTGTGATSPIPTAATGSNKFRIPALTTLSNGWVVAAADVRWNHGADNPGNLDTIVSVSKDNGQTWDWEIVNYFGDYAPSSHDVLSASFIDPALVQDPETGKLWMFIDVTAANGKYGKGSTGFTSDGCLLVANLPAYVGQRAPETPASYTYCVSATPASVTYQGKALRAIVSVADRNAATGYYVDAFMDLYQDGSNGVERVMCDQVGSDKLVQCNLFYKQSEWKVYPCGYLMLRSATVTDTGLVWDDPIFPGNLRGEYPGSGAGFFGACPGRGTITETGRIVFLVYDAVNDNHGAEFASVIYSDDNGATWHRGERATDQADTGKASESQVVCLPDGSLRMYSRNSIGYIGYTDSTDDGQTWGTYQRDTALPYVGNCMISFINLEGYLTDAAGNTYENLILGSYPKGSGRNNGVIRIGYVNTQAAGQPVVWLNDDTVRYSGYYAYSCLTQLQVDGKPAGRFGNFYEGTGSPITYATVSVTDLLGQGWTLTAPDPVVPDPGPDVPDPGPGPDDPEVVTYTVTIDGAPYVVKAGETLGDRMPADPTDPGYRFGGWVAEETNSAFTASTPVTRDLTVVSTWSMVICMVTIGEDVILVPYGTTLGDQMPAAPTYAGYNFAGWLTADGLVFTADTVVTGDLTVTASWTETPPSRPSSGGSTVTPPEEELEEPDTPLAGGVVPSFVDVTEKDWFFADVCAVFGAGIMKGADEAHFQPGTLMDRGMMAQVIFNLEKDPEATAANPFGDVTDGHYYQQAVAWGAEQGILKGYDNGAYGGNDQVTREQMVLMLYRYSEKKGLDMTAEADALSQFTDGVSASSWAVEAVRWAVSKGLLQGRNGGVLDPGAAMTRAELAAVLARYVKLLSK